MTTPTAPRGTSNEDRHGISVLMSMFLKSVETNGRKFAIEALTTAVSQHKVTKDSLYQLANACREQNQREFAIAMYRLLLQRDPDHVPSLINLGTLLREAADATGARSCYERALAIQPKEVVILWNLCGLLYQLGNLSEAAEMAERSAAILPEDPTSHHFLGMIQQSLGQPDQAAVHYERALTLLPDSPVIQLDLASVLQRQNRLTEADRFFESGLARFQDPGAHTRWATQVSIIPASMAAITDERTRFTAGLQRLRESGVRFDDPFAQGASTPYFLAYHGLSDRNLNQDLANFYLEACPSLNWRAHMDAPPSERLRVCIVSAHLYQHTIGRLVRGLIERLNRQEFEVTVCQLGPTDELTTYIAKRADQFVRLQDNLATMRRMVANQRPDILLYPDIGMDPATYFLAFARIAPIQCATWGHPDTTGIPNIDYFLSDAMMEPANADEHYSERLVRLPGLPAHDFRPSIPADIPDRTALGFASNERLYVCVQSLFKLHPDFDTLVADILRQDRRGRLVVVAGASRYWGEHWKQRLGKLAAEILDRVTVIPRLDYTAYFGLLAAADAILDTVHFNGGQTTLEAIAMGAPVVSLPGAFMRGRQTMGMYQRLGLQACIAADRKAYVETAIRLATDREWRHSLQTTIRDREDQLFEGASGLKAIESFFRAAAGR